NRQCRGHISSRSVSSGTMIIPPPTPTDLNFNGFIAGLEWMRHFFRPNPILELLSGQVAQLQSSVLERKVLAVRFERNLGGLLVANVRVEGGHQHQRVVQMFPDSLFVRFDAHGTAIIERARGFSQELYGL